MLKNRFKYIKIVYIWGFSWKKNVLSRVLNTSVLWPGITHKPLNLNWRRKKLSSQKLVLKRPCVVYRFYNCIHVWSKNFLVWLAGGCLCQQTTTNAVFWWSQFQKINFGCLLLELLIDLPKTKTLFIFVYPLWTHFCCFPKKKGGTHKLMLKVIYIFLFRFWYFNYIAKLLTSKSNQWIQIWRGPIIGVCFGC